MVRARPGIVLLVAASACTIEPADTEHASPRVVATSPEHMAADNPRNVLLSFWFDLPLDPASIRTDAIELTSGAVRQGGTVRYDPLERRLVFTPDGTFRHDLAYDAHLSGDLRDLRHGSHVEPMVLTFLTNDQITNQPEPELPSFARGVAPLLLGRCASCHGPVAPPLDLDLSSASAIEITAVAHRANGWPGWPRIEPGAAAWSYLVYKIIGEDTVRGEPMPPDAPLSTGELRTILDWIDGGAKVDL